MSERIGRPQDLQALRRRQVPALRERPLLRGRPTPRAASSPTPRWARARTPATRSSRRARRSPAGPRPRRTTAVRSSTAWPSCSRAGAAQFVDEVSRAKACRGARPRPLSTRRSTAGSGTPGGRTRSPRCTARPTRSPGRTSTSRCRSRPASSPSSRRRSRRCSASSRSSRRRSSPATPSSCSPASCGRCPRSRSPRCSPPPTYPAASSTSSPAAPPRSRRGSPRTWTSTPSTSPARRTPRVTDLEVAARRQPQARPAPGGAPTGPRARHRADARAPRDQDRLAPGRRLSARSVEHRLQLGLGQRSGCALVAAREPSVQRSREPPVGVAEKGHGRRHQHHADEGGVHEDRRGQAEAEHLRGRVLARGRRRGTPRS